MIFGQICIERLSDDLHKEVWYFSLYDEVLYLSAYEKCSRPSRRHRDWTTEKVYGRIGNYLPKEKLTAAEVPFPDDVRAEALEQQMARIRIMSPSEWNKHNGRG